jgi:hypothetical protein
MESKVKGEIDISNSVMYNKGLHMSILREDPLVMKFCRTQNEIPKKGFKRFLERLLPGNFP